jgi:hypothetical protein
LRSLATDHGPLANRKSKIARRFYVDQNAISKLQLQRAVVHRRINGRTSGSVDSLPLIPRLFAWFPILRAFRHY